MEAAVMAPAVQASHPWVRREVIGDCVLYQGDNLEILASGVLGEVDAVVTDPPYGIGFGSFNRTNKDASGKRYKADAYHRGDWDDEFDFSPAYELLKALRVPMVVWGGNYFPCLWADAGKGIAFWHKAQPVKNFSKGELAWTNINMPAQFLNFPYYGGIEGSTTASKKRHPTQKPVAVMKWCLGFVPGARVFLDPFLGSGTTLMACAQEGLAGIGIELEPEYFKVSCERVEEAYQQPDMFAGAPAASSEPEQLGMFGGEA